MAGDWIKMRTDLVTSPKVVRMASVLKADRFRIAGGLLSVWSLFDAHSDDGTLHGYSLETVNELAAWDGFAEAMAAVGWIECDGETLSLPRFDTHNGASAKRRAQDADRKREVRKASASDADGKRTRGEKRREEKKEQKKEPAPRKPKKTKAPEVTFDQWTAGLDGEDAVSADDPIFEWAKATGINPDWIALAWWSFEGRYSDNAKTYADWRAVFRRAVKEDWMKVWRLDARENRFVLTTAGELARLEMEATA